MTRTKQVQRGYRKTRRAGWFTRIEVYAAICTLILTVFMAYIASRQLSISRLQADIAGQQTAIAAKQQETAEKALQLSEAVSHQHIKPILDGALYVRGSDKPPIMAIINESSLTAKDVSVDVYVVGCTKERDICKVLMTSTGCPGHTCHSEELKGWKTTECIVPAGPRPNPPSPSPSKVLNPLFAEILYVIDMTYFRETDMQKFETHTVYKLESEDWSRLRRLDGSELLSLTAKLKPAVQAFRRKDSLRSPRDFLHP